MNTSFAGIDRPAVPDTRQGRGELFTEKRGTRFGDLTERDTLVQFR